MIYPKKLEKGMTIGVICGSSAIPTDERAEKCRKVLEKMGYKCIMDTESKTLKFIYDRK